MKSKKELLINCIGCGEKRCVDETGWCDNCGGEALAENIEKMKQSIKKKHELMDDINDCCVLDIRKRLPQIKKKHEVGLNEIRKK